MNKRTNFLTQEQIVKFLSSTDLFSGIPAVALHDIAAQLEPVYLAGKDTLFHQNTTGDSLYLLIYGLLRVIKENSNGSSSVLADLSAGSIVGEIACLISEPRTASVYAIRDSVLLKMSRKLFDQFVEKYPLAMMKIARHSVKRMVMPKEINQPQHVTCFALVPAGDYQLSMDFSHLFMSKLSEYGKTLLLTEDIFDEIVGKGAANTPLENAKSAEIVAKIHELESKYRFLVYVANKANSWAERCIRQVDKIILIGQHNANPDLGEIEHLLFKQNTKLTPNVNLVLIANKDQQILTGTNDWYTGRTISQHHHIRLDVDKDFNRMIRLMTGNGYGVVLSGGAAAALSHVGTLKALKELNIPIDFIGGTSMGAIIAGLAALELDCPTIINMLEDFLQKFSRHIDYTLPIMALLKGQVLGRLLRSSFGEDNMIEDLWINYFCVSTNLGTNATCVHEKNLMWKAIRASISLPGIFPPVHDEFNSILIDGGILNNLPIDEMKKRINSGKIIASSLKIKNQTLFKSGELEEDTLSGWYLFFKHILLHKLWQNETKKKKNFLSIYRIIHHSMLIASSKHQLETMKMADYNVVIDVQETWMLDFKPMKKIIELGYQTAMQQLQDTDLISRQ